MKRNYRTFKDYHTKADTLQAVSMSWTVLRAVILNEGDGDVQFAATERSGLVLTLDGAAAHLTRMDRIDDDIPSRPGEVCLIPAGLDVHLAWRNHEPIQRSLMVEFDNALFSVYTPEIATDTFLRGHLVPANFSTRPYLGHLVQLIAREADPAQAQGRLFAETAIRLLALEVAAKAWSAPPVLPQGKGRPDTRIARAIDYIETFFARDISILDIAAAAGQSPTQLNLAFRAAMGTSPHSWVIDRRLSHAVQLLRTTDLPIAIIALEAGFNDQPHLTRLCRARLGTTPSQIRRG